MSTLFPKSSSHMHVILYTLIEWLTSISVSSSLGDVDRVLIS